MRTIFISLAAMAAAVSVAGTYSVEPAQWTGGAVPSPYGEVGKSGASLSGTTASWFAKFSGSNLGQQQYNASWFNGVQANVTWKIIWTPSYAGEAAPASAIVIVRARGTIFAKAEAQTLGTASADVDASDSALFLRSIYFNITAPQNNQTYKTMIDGSEVTEVYRDFIFTGNNAAQFTSNGNGGAYAYVGVAINANVTGILSLNSPVGPYGPRGIMNGGAGIAASMRPIAVGGQNF